MSWLLLAAILLPLAGAIALWPASKLGAAASRWIALIVSLATLAFAVAAAWSFVRGSLVGVDIPWVDSSSGIDARISFGLDGLSIWLFALTALLMVPSVLTSWEAITERPALFYAMLLLLEFGCLGVFAARDVILFYVFFEFTLIPLFILIGIWGSEQRRHAAVKFFLFTLAGSLLTFIGLVSLVCLAKQPGFPLTFSIPALTEFYAGEDAPSGLIQCLLFLALFAGFAVKAPLFPLHTWLPLAHVQAPTAGSVFLAGVLLKIGTYGVLRFNVAMLPEASAYFMPLLLWLCVAGILYGALVALAQSDMKRLIAYSSVSHLGFCLLGVFVYNRLGVQGGVLQMVNHGISTGALFALVGMIYERWHTRKIDALGGLARQTPILAFFFIVFTLSSIGLPGTNGFAGEVLLLLGAFQRAWADSSAAEIATQLQVISVLAVLGVVLGAWYMLWLCQRLLFGPLKTPPGAEKVKDLGFREIAALSSLAIFVLWIGLFPGFFLNQIAPAVNPMTAGVEQALTGEQRQLTADVEQPQPTQIGAFPVGHH